MGILDKTYKCPFPCLFNGTNISFPGLLWGLCLGSWSVIISVVIIIVVFFLFFSFWVPYQYFMVFNHITTLQTIFAETVKTAVCWNFQQHQREHHCQLLIKSNSPKTFTNTLRVLDDFMARHVSINDWPSIHHYCIEVDFVWQIYLD